MHKGFLEHFASPILSDDTDLAMKLSQAFGTAVSNRVLSLNKNLRELDWIGKAFTGVDFGESMKLSGWRPEIGLALHCTRVENPIRSAKQLLLGLVDIFPNQSWEFHEQTPCDLFFRGAHFKSVRDLSYSDKKGLVLQFDFAGDIPIVPSSSGMEIGKNRVLYDLNSGGMVEPYSITCRNYDVETNQTIWPLDQINNSARLIEDPSLQEGRSILGNISPDYDKWVDRILKGVAHFTIKGDDTNISSSSTIHPGVIGVRYPISGVDMAEALVHECSHQYYNLLNFCYPLDDGTDDQLYYSTLKKTSRPIGLVLFAFHAAANIALMYEALLECDSGSDYEPEFLEMLSNAFSMLPSIERSPAITEQGHCVWSSLAQRLERHRHLVKVPAN